MPIEREFVKTRRTRVRPGVVDKVQLPTDHGDEEPLVEEALDESDNQRGHSAARHYAYYNTGSHMTLGELLTQAREFEASGMRPDSVVKAWTDDSGTVQRIAVLSPQPPQHPEDSVLAKALAERMKVALATPIQVGIDQAQDGTSGVVIHHEQRGGRIVRRDREHDAHESVMRRALQESMNRLRSTPQPGDH